MSVLQELINLVRDGDLKSVEKFLSNHEVDLNQVHRTAGGTGVGVSPLMVACKNGHLEIAKLLLKKGADVNFENDWHQSALMAAVEGGNVEVVHLLLEWGANTAAIDDKSALTLACEQGSVEVVEALLQKSEFKETKRVFTGYGLGSGWEFSCTFSLVFIAVQHGNRELVKWFLRRGYKVPLGALFQAISQQNNDMVKVLLRKGADVNETGESGWTALMQASYLGDSAIVSTLLKSERKQEIDHMDERNSSALILAAQCKHAEVVTLLLKAGAKVNLKGYNGQTALTFAMQDPYGPILQDPNPHKSVQTVKALLDGGADVNLEEDDGTTPLLLAAGMVGRQWQLEVIELLLEKKPIIDHKNRRGNYALKSAVSTGDIEVVRLLLEGGAKTDMKDGEGKSLLMVRINMYSTCTREQMTKLLLDYGVPIGIRDNEGRDALLYAVTSQPRDYGAIELLLERGADPTLKPDHDSNAKSFLQQNITHVLVSLLAWLKLFK